MGRIIQHRMAADNSLGRKGICNLSINQEFMRPAPAARKPFRQGTPPRKMFRLESGYFHEKVFRKRLPPYFSLPSSGNWIN